MKALKYCEKACVLYKTSSSPLTMAKDIPIKLSKSVQDSEKCMRKICNLVQIVKRAPDPASFAAIDPRKVLELM